MSFYRIDNIKYPVYGEGDNARYNAIIEYFYRLFDMEKNIELEFNYEGRDRVLALRLEREIMEYLTYGFDRRLSTIQDLSERDYIEKLADVYQQLTNNTTSCNITWASTYTGGVTSRASKTSFKPIDLILFAYNMNLEYDKNTPNFTDLCTIINKDFPTLKWEEATIFGGSRKTDEENAAIGSYVSYGFKRMNDELRYNPEGRAILNELIERLPPLSKPIRVYRYAGDVSSWLDKTRSFKIEGYISTSLKPSKAFWGPPTKDWGIMVINVPAGKKGIYIGGSEAEVIFPHNSEFEYVKSEYQPIVFIDENDAVEENLRKLELSDEMYYLTELYPEERLRIGEPAEIIYLNLL